MVSAYKPQHSGRCPRLAEVRGGPRRPAQRRDRPQQSRRPAQPRPTHTSGSRVQGAAHRCMVSASRTRREPAARRRARGGRPGARLRGCRFRAAHLLQLQRRRAARRPLATERHRRPTRSQNPEGAGPAVAAKRHTATGDDPAAAGRSITRPHRPLPPWTSGPVSPARMDVNMSGARRVNGGRHAPPTRTIEAVGGRSFCVGTCHISHSVRWQ